MSRWPAFSKGSLSGHLRRSLYLQTPNIHLAFFNAVISHSDLAVGILQSPLVRLSRLVPIYTSLS